MEDEAFFGGVVLGVICAFFVAVMAYAIFTQHDIGMDHNVCMVIDEKNTQRCINGRELLEILRKQ